MEQHDDHIWLTVQGEGWAIRGIRHNPDGSLMIYLWRGYVPHIEWKWVLVEEPDWPAYCEAAAALLEKAA